MEPLRATLLLVDDDRDVLELLSHTFSPQYEALLASSAEEALRILRSRPVDLIVTDLRMPGLSGLELLAEARRIYPQVAGILLTAYLDTRDLLAAANEGLFHRYVIKPFDGSELLMTVHNALEAVRLKRDRDALERRLERRLDAMSVLIDLGVETAARTNYHQLLEAVTRALPRIVEFDVAATLVVPQGRSGPAEMHIHCHSRVDEATLLVARDRAVELYSSLVGADLGEGQLVVNVSGEQLHAGTPQRPVRSALAIPVTIDDNTLGALVLVAHRPEAFTDDDRRTLDLLANQTAQAVRRLQDRLVDERRKMALMVEAMADGLIMTDGSPDVFLINPAARRLLGLPPDEPVTTHYLKDRLGFYPFDLMRAAAGAEPVREEVMVGERVLHSIVSPVTDGAGAFVGVVVVLRDITAEKQLEQRKDEFVSIVSHELRTPLTSITGALDIVLSQYMTGLTEKQVRYLEMARDSSQTLNKIVDDLLDVAKFERGKLTIHMGAFDFTRHLRETVERFRAPAEAKGITLVMRSSVDARVVGDADRLGQVMNNLLANAIKFTPERSGRVIVKLFGPSATPGWVGVSVWNSGDPIPPESRERVFEKFEQLEQSATRKSGGTGLGLAIARGIIEGHGGRIWVEPISDGAKFAFVIPVSPHEPAADEPPKSGPIRVSPRKALLVDDDQDARLIFKGMLLADGWQVETGGDADEALVLARGHEPDVISIDLQMDGPTDTGIAVIEILKHDPETRSIPVLALSAANEQERATAVGVEAFLRKPVDGRTYAATMNRLVTERGRTRQRVLLVDDDAQIRVISRDVLEQVGYSVAEADGSAAALPEARRFRPDLILLDVMMPDGDGFSTAQRLRNDRSSMLTPIIFLSARGQTADKVRAFKLGAEDYLVKPFDHAELIARVQKALARRDAEIGASPTTKLPGSQAIEVEIDRRLSAGGDFAFCYLDLDNLKAFNDYYGYAKADGVIRQTGDIIREVVAKEGGGGDFIGHIAGDDFVFITTAERVDAVCKAVAATFDRLIPLYYNRSDRERGHIETLDRYGEQRRFPLMTVSIAALTHTRAVRNHSELALAVAELKAKAKAIPRTAYVRDGEVVLPGNWPEARPARAG